MRDFYTESYSFWIGSKVILAVLLLLSAIPLLMEGGLRAPELAVNLLTLIEAILLCVTLAQDYSSTSSTLLKIITGALLILGGIALCWVLLTISKGSRSTIYYLGYPFSIWMFFTGIFEVMRIKKKTINIL